MATDTSEKGIDAYSCKKRIKIQLIEAETHENGKMIKTRDANHWHTLFKCTCETNRDGIQNVCYRELHIRLFVFATSHK